MKLKSQQDKVPLFKTFQGWDIPAFRQNLDVQRIVISKNDIHKDILHLYSGPLEISMDDWVENYDLDIIINRINGDNDNINVFFFIRNNIITKVPINKNYDRINSLITKLVYIYMNEYVFNDDVEFNNLNLYIYEINDSGYMRYIKNIQNVANGEYLPFNNQYNDKGKIILNYLDLENERFLDAILEKIYLRIRINHWYEVNYKDLIEKLEEIGVIYE